MTLGLLISFNQIDKAQFKVWSFTMEQGIETVLKEQIGRFGTVASTNSFHVTYFLKNIPFGMTFRNWATPITRSKTGTKSRNRGISEAIGGQVMTWFSSSVIICDKAWLLPNFYATWRIYKETGSPGEGIQHDRALLPKNKRHRTWAQYLTPFSLRWRKIRGAFDSAKNHKRQRHKRQSVTAKREKSQTPKFV